MKSAAICCYYGKLPSYFECWLTSASQNTEIDFFIVTDLKTINKYRELIDETDNVKLVFITFDELRDKIQSLFDFKISLGRPYKLCDYRLTFGLVFEDILVDYDYFGWFDLDVILGDLGLIFEKQIEQYDVIGTNGHLTLLRNTQKFKFLFYESINPQNLATPYTIVFRCKRSCFFDENNGLRQLLKDCKVKDIRSMIFDVYPFKHDFFEWNNHSNHYIVYRDNTSGKLYRISENCKDEIAYVHLQKRNINIEKDVSNLKSFYIKPNTISWSAEYVVNENSSYYKAIYKKFKYERTISQIINYLSNYRAFPKRIFKMLFR